MLHLLLDGVLIRHSKSQVYDDDTSRSILALPPARHSSVALSWEEDGPEAAAYAYLEYGAVESFNLADAAGEPAGGERPTVTATELLRRFTISASLVNGGAGVRSRLNDLNGLRRRVADLRHRRGLGHVQPVLDANTLKTMTADGARDFLLLPQEKSVGQNDAGGHGARAFVANNYAQVGGGAGAQAQAE